MKRIFFIIFFLLLNYSLLTIDTFAEETKNKDPLEELKVKREEVFEFVQKPTLKQQGDHIEISFETKGFCDVTIAIENKEGKILRHLVSGVLGANAPAPLQKNSKNKLLFGMEKMIKKLILIAKVSAPLGFLLD